MYFGFKHDAQGSKRNRSIDLDEIYNLGPIPELQRLKNKAKKPKYIFEKIIIFHFFFNLYMLWATHSN